MVRRPPPLANPGSAAADDINAKVKEVGRTCLTGASDCIERNRMNVKNLIPEKSFIPQFHLQ